MPNELQQAIELVKAGKKAEGGQILAELIKREPNNEQAWLWLSACVKPVEQKRHCLKQTLQINPNNEYARKQLSSLDSLPSISNNFSPPKTNKFSTGKRIAIVLGALLAFCCIGSLGLMAARSQLTATSASNFISSPTPKSNSSPNIENVLAQNGFTFTMNDSQGHQAYTDSCNNVAIIYPDGFGYSFELDNPKCSTEINAAILVSVFNRLNPT